MSQLLEITASIIQGSVIGPVSYVVSASDLSAVTPGNSMFKYADDTYMYVVIPACNALSRDAELDNVAKWPSQIICSSTERNKSRSFLRTDDAGLSPAIHRRCLTSEE